MSGYSAAAPRPIRRIDARHDSTGLRAFKAGEAAGSMRDDERSGPDLVSYTAAPIPPFDETQPAPDCRYH